MALLINKPKRVVINTSVQLTINRPELASMFGSDVYWGNTSNWKTVYFYYRDPTGSQNITVIFPEGKSQAAIFPSPRVKQAGWILDKVVVKDYDRGLKTLLRGKNLAKLSECDIVIAVANRTPSDIFLSNTSPVENQTFVGNLTATDPDVLDPLTYTVVNDFGDAEAFQIVGNNALHFKVAPSYEIKNQYSVKIRVTDSSDAFYEEVFTINVVDANDAPSDITLSNNTILENRSVNTVIGTLSAVDEDTGASVTLSLVGGDISAFNLNGNQLRSSISFNYEEKANYSITIRAADNVGATYEEVFNISVLNENETPTGISISSSSINEWNSINDVVGILSTTDMDGVDAFTYSIIAGDASAFNINGNQLRASQVFDFETKNLYNITIRSTDAGGLSYDKSFAISVSNVAESPTDIVLSNNTINENAAINTVIGTLSATKPTSQAVSFSLVGGDVASFNINGTQLRSSAVFDFETKSSYSVTVRGSSGGETFDKALTINVNNMAEAPSNILLSNTSIAENNLVNAVIGTLSTVGDSATFSIIGGDTSAFNINGNELRASIAFDRESKASYSVTIRGTTPFGFTLDRTFAVTITDIDEFRPTSVRRSGGTVYGTDFSTFANASIGGALFNLGVADSDGPDYYDQYGTYGGVRGKHRIELVSGIGYGTSGGLAFGTWLPTEGYYGYYYEPISITDSGSSPFWYRVVKNHASTNTSYFSLTFRVWDTTVKDNRYQDFTITVNHG